MENINTWKKFNELNASTYRNAGKLAAEYGDTGLQNRFKDHSNFISDMDNKKSENDQISEYSNLGEFEFSIEMGNGPKLPLVGKFGGFDWSMTSDIWDDSNNTVIEIPVFFMLSNINHNLPPELICPFWIDGNFTENGDIENLTISGPFNVEEAAIGKHVGEGDNPILFTNRKDAAKFINELKRQAKLNYAKIISPNGIFKEERPLEQTINKLNVRQLYR